MRTPVRAPPRIKSLKLIRDIHLWVSLVVGLPIVLVSATGLPITYWGESDALLSPSYYRATSRNSSPASFDALAAAARSVAGLKSLDSIFLTPQYGTALATITLTNGESREVSLDLGAAKVIATRDLNEAPITWIYRFHTRLLLDRMGEDAAGRVCLIILAAAQAILLITGLFLWWPRRELWPALKPIIRKQYLWRDLHSKLGIYVLPVMLVVSVTAILLSIPATRMVGASLKSSEPRPLSPAPANRIDQRRTLADLARAGAVHGPGLETLGIFDIDGAGPLLVLTTGKEEEEERWTSVDRSTGSVLRMDLRDPRSSGDVPYFLIGLHQGHRWGDIGKLLFAVASVVPLLLFVTGLVVWLRGRTRRQAAAGANRSSAFST